MIGKIEDIIREKYDSVNVPENLLDFNFIEKIISKNEKIFMNITAVLILIAIFLSIWSFNIDKKLEKNYNIYNNINTSIK